ncbi:unnamed protein product [Lampetra planeri]
MGVSVRGRDMTLRRLATLGLGPSSRERAVLRLEEGYQPAVPDLRPVDIAETGVLAQPGALTEMELLRGYHRPSLSTAGRSVSRSTPWHRTRHSASESAVAA